MKQSVANIQDVLNEWQGGEAVFWHYTASHGHLELRILSSKDRKGNIHLICEDCRRINGPTAWPSVSIIIEETGNDLEGRYRVVDRNVKFEVICDLIKINQDVEPIY